MIGRTSVVMVVLLLAGFGVLAAHSAWVLEENSRALNEVEHREAIAELYHDAEVAVLAAEAEGTRFVAAPDATSRERFEASVQDVALALTQIAENGDAADRAIILGIFSDFASERAALPAMLDAIESGGATQDGLGTEIVESMSERLQVRHVEVRSFSEAALADFRNSQKRQLTVAATVFGLGVPLLVILLVLFGRYKSRERLAKARLATLDAISRTDELTGIGNLRAFQEYLDDRLNRARSGGNPLSLAVLDIDYFKLVNDKMGHSRGDEVLSAFAGILKQETAGASEPGMAFRLGGDEFALVLPSMSEDDGTRLLREVRRHVTSQLPGVTYSAGLASLMPDDKAASELRERADQALYLAKESGRDRVVEYASAGANLRKQAAA